MKELPILFKGPMVVAVMNDTKTETRRIVNRVAGKGMITEFGKTDTPGYDFHFRDRSACWNDVSMEWMLEHSPWQVGQIRYVRETCVRFTGIPLRGNKPWPRDAQWAMPPNGDPYKALLPKAGNGPAIEMLKAAAACVSVPSIHVPKWAARIRVEITDVKLERVQEITWQAALREGIVPEYCCSERDCGCMGLPIDDPVQEFHILWDSINDNPPKRPYGWDVDPFVWPVRFWRLP